MAIKETKGKPQVDLVHYSLIKAVAEVRTFGINKYQNDEDWKTTPVRTYVAAAIRHLYKYLWENELDNESGLRHLAHAATSLDLALTLDDNNKGKV